MVTVGAVRTPGKRDRGEKKEEETPSAGSAIASSTDLEAGDRVVYPKQGVYRVAGHEQKDIAGQRLEFVKMTREEDGATVLVPLNKVASIGLRRVASTADIEGVFHYLGASYDDPELDWKVRHRDNVERLIAGGVLGVAEVVKGLHSLSRLRPLPAKERELYDSSRHLLVNEIAVSLGVPDVIAEDYVDFALMPPAGVKLPLKPPPTPVELKGPPWKRKKVVVADEEDELGLGDLGIDLGALEVEEPEASEAGEERGGQEGEAPVAEEEKAAPLAKTAPKAPPAKAPAAVKPAPKAPPPKASQAKPTAKTAAKPPPAKAPATKAAPARTAPAKAGGAKAGPSRKPAARAPAKRADRKATGKKAVAARKGSKPARGKKK
jgi:RNA polymerase-interacting CarD/CdnL/TRCF family regulator